MDPEELKQWNEWTDEEKRDAYESALKCLSQWRDDITALVVHGKNMGDEIIALRNKIDDLEYTQEWILTAWGWDQDALERFIAEKEATRPHQ